MCSMEQHSEILPRLAAFHDGQLVDSERQEIEAHLEQCSECRERLSEWQVLDRALLAMPLADAPPLDLHRRTREALAMATSEAARTRRVPKRFWLAAAALFVLAFTGALLWRSGPPKQEMAAVPVVLPEAKTESPAPAAQDVAPAPAEPSAPMASSAPSQAESKSVLDYVEPLARLNEERSLSKPTASGLVGTGDTGIPQLSDWPARLTEAEWNSLSTLSAKRHTRIPQYLAPLEIAEINLMPLFDDAFVAVGYKPLVDPLNPGHEAAYSDPVLLTPETAYLVSNLRLEQASLWARSQEEKPTADEVLQLAEVSWRLANLTADRDDVKGAIAAHTLAMQRRPEWADAARTRLTALRALDKP